MAWRSRRSSTRADYPLWLREPGACPHDHDRAGRAWVFLEAIGGGDAEAVDVELVVAAADVCAGGVRRQDEGVARQGGALGDPDDGVVVLERGVEVLGAERPVAVDLPLQAAAELIAVGARVAVVQLEGIGDVGGVEAGVDLRGRQAGGRISEIRAGGV